MDTRAIRWLLSGELNRCESLAATLSGVGGVAVAIRLSLLGFTAFCAYIALGWRTSCAAAKSSNGRRCNNNVRGVVRGCHIREHKKQKRRALWRSLFVGDYPGDRITRLTPVLGTPAFRRELARPKPSIPSSDGLNVARASLFFTVVGAVATVAALFR